MIINSSKNLYNRLNAAGAATISGSTDVSATLTLAVRKIYSGASFICETSVTAIGHGLRAGAVAFRGATAITARGNTRLPLVAPAPILNQISVGAFQKRFYTARLLDNLNNEIKFTGATLEAPRGAVGKRISINVAKKDLALISNSKTYTLQIGTRETPIGAITWQTVIQNGKLNSRSFALNGNLAGDQLSFGAVEPLKNKLNKYPLTTTIFYNPNKTSVSIADTDTIRDSTGAESGLSLRPFNYLSLYTLLDFVRNASGFSSFVTNLPNFEITRADFPITQSYLQAISGIIGIFEPVIFTVGSTLYVLDKTAAIPDEFEPRTLNNVDLSNWSISIPEQNLIDGYLVSYTNSDTQANYYTERLVQKSEETGVFGHDDYGHTEIETTWREWRSFDAPDVILRSEIRYEKRETYEGLVNLIAEETETHEFDNSGRRTGTTRTIKQLIPDLSGGTTFETVSEETQNIFYATDPRESRRSYQQRIETRRRGLIAIDSENQYLGEDFKQNFLKAHEAGNLKEGMTTEYGPLETKVVNFAPLGNGQYQVYGYTYDHIRKIKKEISGEPATGDASLSSSVGKQSQILVFPDGVTNANRAGNGIETLAVGELPLFFAVPLVKRKLTRRFNQTQSGTANVAGYDNSIERGTFFRLFDRSNNNAGRFLTLGYRVDIQPIGDGAIITTAIESDEI